MVERFAANDIRFCDATGRKKVPTEPDGEFVHYSDYATLEAKLAKRDAELARARDELEWYGENARLARLIHSGGDAGRHALAADGGKRARKFMEDTDGRT